MFIVEVYRMAMISTRGRYALRVMLDLAEHNTGEYITLMDIAQRQNISEKYLENIIAALSKNGFLQTMRGRGGGYKLARRPELYTVGSILQVTEGDLVSVACLEQGANPCCRSGDCRTLPMWAKLDQLVSDYLESVTLADLLTKRNDCNVRDE